ncbi:MAG: sigma-70 family RNA polymerase sigma factor [Planctomycetaceae bacterium]|nr:sigma-70 family RNA polymerase sigma factor [Planctomycetaceae bacterium]
MERNVADLLLRAKKGERQAIGQLLEHFRSYLKLIASHEIGSKLGAKLDASDVVQDTFLDAHRYFENFQGESVTQFTAWLRSVMAGVMANYMRRYLGTKARDIRLEKQLAADLDNSAAMLSELLVASISSPSQNIMRDEQTVQLAKAMSNLSADYQSVLTLRHIEGLTFPQIATRLNRTVDSVEKLWLRAVVQLRKSFSPQEQTDAQ